MKELFYPEQDINDIIESEETEFYKGGIGSGKKGHRTPKEALSDRLSAKGIPKEKHWMYTDKTYRQSSLENHKESAPKSSEEAMARNRFKDQLKDRVKVHKD